MKIINTNAITSAISVPLTSSRPASATSGVMNRSLDFGCDDEDEEDAEREVDEVHALDQADDEEHGRCEPSLRVGLTGDAVDGGVAGQAVTDCCADGTSAERQARGDHPAHDSECVIH